MKKEYKEEEYRIIFGVDKITFDTMVKIVENEYNIIHKKGAEKTDRRHKKESKLFKIFKTVYFSKIFST